MSEEDLKIISKISEGHFSTVFLVKDKEESKFYLKKDIFAKKNLYLNSSNKRNLGHINREISILKALEGKKYVPLYKFR